MKTNLFSDYDFFLAFGATAGAADGAGAEVTSPLIVKITDEFSALLITVIVFVKAPGRPEVLYPTLITLLPPGMIASFENSGVVHPQEACAFEITTGAVPVFVTSKL